MTDLAARRTLARHDTVGIYLPHRVARYNKQTFGTLYPLGTLWALWMCLKPDRIATHSRTA